MFGHTTGQSSLGVALALAKLCGGTCSVLGHARRVASMSPGLLNVGSGRWHHHGLPSKHSSIFHNVSLCYYGLTAIALHLPWTRPMELNQIMFTATVIDNTLLNTSNIVKTVQILRLAQLVVADSIDCSCCTTRSTYVRFMPTWYASVAAPIALVDAVDIGHWTVVVDDFPRMATWPCPLYLCLTIAPSTYQRPLLLD